MNYRQVYVCFFVYVCLFVCKSDWHLSQSSIEERETTLNFHAIRLKIEVILSRHTVVSNEKYPSLWFVYWQEISINGKKNPPKTM
jgi:hypothetical protein